MKHLKILHILDHSLPIHSGYTFRSNSIFEAQRKRGWDPIVLTGPKHEANWKKDSAKQEIIQNTTYYRTGNLHQNVLPGCYEINLMRILKNSILEVAQKEKPDIIHAHSPVLNAIPMLYAARQLKLPTVYEIRGFWEDAAVDHGTYAYNSWRDRITKQLETWICRRVDQIAVLCNGIKNDLITRGIAAGKMTVVFNGVSPQDFQPCAPDPQYIEEWHLRGKQVIGFFGSFYHYEGLELLVEAFASLVPDYPDIRLLLLGGGPMEQKIREQVQALSLQNRVIIPGRIPHERMPGIYGLVDILAYPRHSMRLTELVTPLKPLEAMSMGKAIIASDVGGHKELILHQKTGILFPADNQHALALGLRELLSNQELRQTLVSQCRDWVIAHHSWDKTTAVYEEIYARALHQ